VGQGHKRELVKLGFTNPRLLGIYKDVMFGFPVTCENGEYKVVEGLEIDAFSQGCIDKTLKELTDEQAGVAHLI
jgi:malate dehydrogenase